MCLNCSDDDDWKDEDDQIAIITPRSSAQPLKVNHEKNRFDILCQQEATARGKSNRFIMDNIAG